MRRLHVSVVRRQVTVARHDVSRGRLARASLVLVISALVVGALIVGLTRFGGSTERSEAVLSEPYAPFRMTYVSYDSGGDSITVDLTWRSRLSWDTKVLAATRHPDQVGSYERYHHGVSTSYNAMFSEHRTDMTYDGSDARFLVPAFWLIPYAFTTDPRWESLGRDAAGYDLFQRVRPGAGQYREIFKRDPETGIVMEVVRVSDSESVTVAEVLTYRPLATADARN